MRLSNIKLRHHPNFLKRIDFFFSPFYSVRRTSYTSATPSTSSPPPACMGMRVQIKSAHAHDSSFFEQYGLPTGFSPSGKYTLLPCLDSSRRSTEVSYSHGARNRRRKLNISLSIRASLNQLLHRRSYSHRIWQIIVPRIQRGSRNEYLVMMPGRS